MKRDYANSDVKQEVATFFYGTEVEKTPAAGMLTLFVVGVHTAEEVLQQIANSGMNITHVYFGANQSFPHLDKGEMALWEPMIKGILKAGYWATLDVEPANVIDVLEAGFCEFRRFIPMISVKLPYIDQLNYNATIKIDDTGFEATNPGVWCHRVHDLKDTSKFTTWDKYTEDKIIK